VNNPWEQRDTAISAGFDPASLTERAARRRTGDAGLGREVVVPIFLKRRPSSSALGPSEVGMRVRLNAGGDIIADRGVLPVEIPDLDHFWLAVIRAAGDSDAVRSRERWTRVVVRTGPPEVAFIASLVLRDSDWTLLRAALARRARPVSEPQDAPVERVVARFLGRLDGVDGTRAAGLWGRLALEVVTLRIPERLADTTSLRWYASWGQGGFPAGSGGRAGGSAGHGMLLDLTQQRVRVDGRLFRVRTLPDWEREQAAHDLGLPPGRLMAWPVSPLPVLLAFFDDITPAPLADDGPQDAPLDPRSRRGPQDSSHLPVTRRGPQDAR
jgi:hypothetical protein